MLSSAHRTAKEASTYTAVANRWTLATSWNGETWGKAGTHFVQPFRKAGQNENPKYMKYKDKSKWVVTPTGVGFVHKFNILVCPTAPKGVIDSIEENRVLSNPNSGVAQR